MREDEYVHVPVAWFETLAKMATNVDVLRENERDYQDELSTLIGWVSSVNSIVKKAEHK